MQAVASVQPNVRPTIYRILFAISLVHLLNDSMQSVIPAMFPILEKSMNLSYFQIGLIAFTLNMTASVMQPFVGFYSDAKPSPYLLPLGMAMSLLGMLGVAVAPNFIIVLLAVMLIGLGSAIFHPEASRVAYMAAGPRRGLAQSIFQVGGNSGQSLAPIMTALIFVPLGQFGAIWFTFVAALAIVVQMYIAKWYQQNLQFTARAKNAASSTAISGKRRKQITVAMLLLIFFVFARSWYHAGITNYYQFYLIKEYGISIERAQIYIFLFLAAGAVGTFFGGPLSDRFGKRNIMMFSMLGSAPLALVLPYANLFWAYVICLVNGFILLSSFSVMVVYAQEMLPGKVGTASGLISGLAFGMGAIGAASLGGLADLLNISFVMKFISFLPALGLLAFFLPSDETLRKWSKEAETA